LLQQLYQRYQEKVKSSPDEPVYHNALGNACLAIDPTDPEDRARRAYERAMGLDPTLSPPLNNLAIIHFRNNDLETAEKLFRAYIGLEPTDAVARINLAELLTREIEADPVNTNRLEVARSALEVARTMNEGSSRVQKLWGRWYEAQDREEEALAAYRRGLALDSDDRFLIQKVERLGWDVESSGGDGMAVRGSADAANKP